MSEIPERLAQIAREERHEKKKDWAWGTPNQFWGSEVDEIVAAVTLRYLGEQTQMVCKYCGELFELVEKREGDQCHHMLAMYRFEYEERNR